MSGSVRDHVERLRAYAQHAFNCRAVPYCETCGRKVAPFTALGGVPRWWCEHCRLGSTPLRCTCGLDDLLAQVGESTIPEWETNLRRYLWLSHGHRGMYGDDGELQCVECAPFHCVDYKRAPLADVVRAATQASEAVSIALLVKAQAESRVGESTPAVEPEKGTYQDGWNDALKALAGATRKVLAPESLQSLIGTLAGRCRWRLSGPDGGASTPQKGAQVNAQRNYNDPSSWATGTVESTRPVSEPRRPWPDPTPEMLNDPHFEAVWQCIKAWDINVPGVDGDRMYSGATGNHVRAILDALAAVDAPTPGAAQEVCVCAAVRLPDGRVIRGHRHDDCLQTLKKLAQVDGSIPKHLPQDAQGFVTSRCRFVGRREAMRLHKAAGLKSAGYDCDLHGDVLFSEDIYAGQVDVVLASGVSPQATKEQG